MLTAEVILVVMEVLRLCSVHEWEPHSIAPCEVETEVIMCDINSTEIPVFVPKKVENVN